MTWYLWRCWRLARGFRENGTYPVYDNFGTWKHIGFGYFWLVEKKR